MICSALLSSWYFSEIPEELQVDCLMVSEENPCVILLDLPPLKLPHSYSTRYLDHSFLPLKNRKKRTSFILKLLYMCVLFLKSWSSTSV